MSFILFTGSLLAFWMMLGGMVVQAGPRAEELAAVLARVGVRTRKVNVLDVLAQIEPAVLDHATERAAVAAAAVQQLLDIGVQASNWFYEKEN